ncbi:hypothetical protein TPHA_0A02280 [Tetrapisispora phaffii CBS 4417]|uniref:Uncharacterized protein n=1 Tax=Tetrapisispora phaffii (strain ATCC 24235 / CBS 4417 / NBRC 1672 / NRRL Y-8282 / UCD 70-5) TaxID=1071381 RepID=G8BN32_TETPH|nr:hypothetical protein TPHA_0A02280 [Tetrapisispora phaffii CBS 4417]CCE61310.1 hypothetical protein TPHA_0A02280 [Tetrapisispora phaffii CBS 4417]
MLSKDFLTTNDSSLGEDYSKSTDFVNLDDPPTPLETPDLSQVNLSNLELPQTSSPVQKKRPVSRHQRRHSTNYKDALQLRRNSSNIDEALNDKYTQGQFEDISRNGTEGPFYGTTMCQNTHPERHESGKDGSDQECLYTVHSNLSGNLKKQRNHYNTSGDMHGKPTTKVEHIQHRHGDNRGERKDLSQHNDLESTPRDEPRLYRKNSFEYEDFKKHMYNRLNMFND